MPLGPGRLYHRLRGRVKFDSRARLLQMPFAPRFDPCYNPLL